MKWVPDGRGVPMVTTAIVMIVLVGIGVVAGRRLKNYIPDGQTATEKTCGECATEGLVYVEGCVTCNNCGFAKCG